MREDTAYRFLTSGGGDPEQAAAISKIFAIKHNTPQERAPVIAGIREKTGLSEEEAALLVDIFLERRTLQ
jgi:hypothetical protein